MHSCTFFSMYLYKYISPEVESRVKFKKRILLNKFSALVEVCNIFGPLSFLTFFKLWMHTIFDTVITCMQYKWTITMETVGNQGSHYKNAWFSKNMFRPTSIVISDLAKWKCRSLCQLKMCPGIMANWRWLKYELKLVGKKTRVPLGRFIYTLRVPFIVIVVNSIQINLK